MFGANSKWMENRADAEVSSLNIGTRKPTLQWSHNVHPRGNQQEKRKITLCFLQIGRRTIRVVITAPSLFFSVWFKPFIPLSNIAHTITLGSNTSSFCKWQISKMIWMTCALASALKNNALNAPLKWLFVSWLLSYWEGEIHCSRDRSFKWHSGVAARAFIFMPPALGCLSLFFSCQQVDREKIVFSSRGSCHINQYTGSWY